MSKWTKLVSCAVLTVPGAGLAQDITGATTLGYAHNSLPGDFGGDEDAYTLDAVGDIGFRNGFTLGLDGSLAHVDPDVGGGDGTFVDLGVELKYQHPVGAIFGGYVDYINIGGNGELEGDLDATSYGFIAGYGNELFTAEANIGWTDASADGFESSSDWTDYGLTVAYTPFVTTKIAGHWQLSDVDSRFGGTNITSYGIGASHDFGAGFLGFGGVSRVNYEVDNTDATSFGLGVGYDLAQVSNLPALVSVELARTTFDDAEFGDVDSDTIRLGVTVPLGGRPGSAPLNSLADSVMSPRHNVLSTLYDNAY